MGLNKARKVASPLRLVQANSHQEFMSAPEGRYVLGRSYCVFCAEPELRGHAVWGIPTLDEMETMVRLLQIACRPKDVPHRWLVDLRHLGFIDPRAFALMVSFVQRHRGVLAHNILGQAQLRPPGMLGAVISGFSAIAVLPYRERVFEDVNPALDWLGIERRRGWELLDQLDTVRRLQRGAGAVVARLRPLLLEAPRVPIALVSARLGLSVRDLQRKLREEGTSFRAEVRSVQLERARGYLAEEMLSIAEVATAVGFSSPQAFATAFRQETGESPTDWRARRGQGGGATR